MKIRMNPFGLLSSGLAILAMSCGAADSLQQAEEQLTLELATHVAALEANEDGDDEESADTTESEPILVRGCGLALVREKLVERFDADGSDELEPEELQSLSEEFGGAVRPNRGLRRHATRQLRRRRLLTVYDADQSGDLSDEEKRALEADLVDRCEARQAELLAQFDSDSSGSLDDDEWAAAHQAIRAKFSAHHNRLLEAFDEDGDGRLNHDERHEARRAKHEAMSERRDALLEEFDADGDGELNDEEHAALRDALREQVRTPRGARPGRQNQPSHAGDRMPSNTEESTTESEPMQDGGSEVDGIDQ